MGPRIVNPERVFDVIQSVFDIVFPLPFTAVIEKLQSSRRSSEVEKTRIGGGTARRG